MSRYGYAELRFADQTWAASHLGGMKAGGFQRQGERVRDIKVTATDEAAPAIPGVDASGFKTVDLSEDVSDRLDDLAGTVLDILIDGGA